MASLKFRFLFFATVILLLFSLSSAWILGASFQASIQDRAQEQLKLHVYGLLSRSEYEKNQFILPDTLADPRFNQLQSGLYAVVLQNKNMIWNSQSNYQNLKNSFPIPLAGQWQFDEFQDEQGQSYYRAMFTAFWESPTEDTSFTFVVWETDQPYVAQITSFKSTLWQGFSALVLLSILMVSLLLYWGFRPFIRLAQEVRQIENAECDQIEGRYPVEITPLVNNVNRLIEHERRLRERYKNSLGNLAHSLKTPLAVMKGLSFFDSENDVKNQEILGEQLSRMNEIVDYQLKRAISFIPKNNMLGPRLSELFDKMVRVLSKVYADKNIHFMSDIDPVLRLPWEEGDALELLGNLMDNACKYGKSKVKVKGWCDSKRIYLAIEDDGPGIKIDSDKDVLGRGVRLDEVQPGQGIGLSIVNDIITIGHGNIIIEKSSLGGARILVNIPILN